MKHDYTSSEDEDMTETIKDQVLEECTFCRTFTVKQFIVYTYYDLPEPLEEMDDEHKAWLPYTNTGLVNNVWSDNWDPLSVYNIYLPICEKKDCYYDMMNAYHPLKEGNLSKAGPLRLITIRIEEHAPQTLLYTSLIKRPNVYRHQTTTTVIMCMIEDYPEDVVHIITTFLYCLIHLHQE